MEDPILVSGDWFITPLSVTPEVDKCLRPEFIAAHVSKDGRDLVILSGYHHIVFLRDFERICRGETTLERAALALCIPSGDTCHYLGFEHGRVCVATVEGFYIFTFGPDLSAKAVFVLPSEIPSETPPPSPMSCMQLTDRRIYFTWGDTMRRQDIPLY